MSVECRLNEHQRISFYISLDLRCYLEIKTCRLAHRFVRFNLLVSHLRHLDVHLTASEEEEKEKEPKWK